MRNYVQKSVAFLLALCMVFTLLPTVAMAEENVRYGEVYLSDLDYVSGTAGDDIVRYDIGYKGTEQIALYITDTETKQTFSKGVFAHAASEIVYDISGMAAARFQAYAGVIENGTRGWCGFGVYTDLSDEPLWSAVDLGYTELAQFVDVEIPAGATRLILRTDNGTETGGYRAWGDHSVWADAKLLVNTTADSITIDETLTVPKYESAAISAVTLKDGEPCDVMIQWESSNEAVATVKNGVVTGLKRGEAVITASVTDANGKTLKAQCAVTVGLQTYDMADGWEMRNADDRVGWDILDENTVTILTQKGDYSQSGGEYTVDTHNLMLHGVEGSDFTATVKLDYAPSKNYESAGLVIYGSDSANVVFVRRSHSYFGGNVIGLFGINDNQFTESNHIADPSAEQGPIWLRIAKSGTTLTLSYSLDGEEFVQNGETVEWSSFSGLEAGDLKVGVWASDGNANNVTWATFSDLTVQYGEAEPTAIPFAAEAVDATGNRLVNPGFEDGLTGWTTSGNSGLASNYPFSGTGHYYTNGAETDYLSQSVTVPADGVYELSAAMAGSGLLKLVDAEGNVLTSVTHLGQGYQIQECEPVELSKGDVVTVVLAYTPGEFYWSNGDDVVFQLQTEEEAYINYLSDWDWISATTAYDVVRKDIGVEGKTISLIVDDDGTTKTFTKAISAHAASEVVYDIEGKGVVRFQSYVGINNTSGACGFEVYTDLSAAPIAQIDCVYGSEKVGYIDVEIPSEATRLILKTTDGGNGINYDHSIWAEPIVTVNTTADDVSLDVSTMLLDVDASKKLIATAITDGEPVTTVIKWESSDETVATVQSGVVTGHSEGTATISATIATDEGGTVTASCEVTVVGADAQPREEAVAQVIAMIEALAPVTADDAEAVAQARRAYELLIAAEQALVTNYADLEAAELELMWLDLELGEAENGRLTLPLETGSGAALYWETNDTAHLTENGIVTPDAEKDVTVILTATMVDGENTYTRDFAIEIPADPEYVARERMNILQIGDSNTEFGYLTQNMKDIVNDDRGDYGTGFVTLCTHITTWKAPKNISISQSGSWSQYDMAGDGQDGDNPDSLNGLSAEGYTGATIRIKFTGSAADIYYLSKPGAGQFTISVDGVDYGAFNADVAGEHLTQVAACDDLKYGKHEMLITVTSGSVVFHGVDVIVGDRDTRSTVHTWGNGTARAKDYSELNESVFASGLQAVNPNKVVIALGTNDHGYGYGNASGNQPIPADEFEESLVTIIEMIQRALPDAEIWLMSTFETNDTFRPQSLPTLYEYWETAFPNAAERTGVNFWDMGNWFGEFDGVSMQDTWHVNSKYGKIIMQKLYDLMSGSPMTPEELAAAIDALIVTNGEQVDEVQDLLDRCEALSGEDFAVVGEERVEKLENWLTLAMELSLGLKEVILNEGSPNGFHTNLTEKTTAGLTIHEGKVALEGWFHMDQEGAGEYYAEVLSGENSYTAYTQIYIDSAMKDDPNRYHMVYSTGDRGTALRVERESSGLRLNIFVYTGSGWVAANSGNLDDEMLDRWLDVAVVYDAEADTVTLYYGDQVKTATGATGLNSTDYGLGIGYCPQETLRKNNLKISCLCLMNSALTAAELSEAGNPDDALVWYNFSDYTVQDTGVEINPAIAEAEALIAAIGEVTLDSEEAITAARQAFDALSEDEQAQVSNADVLIAAEAALKILKDDAELDAAKEEAIAEAQAMADAHKAGYCALQQQQIDAQCEKIIASINEAESVEDIDGILAAYEAIIFSVHTHWCHAFDIPDVDTNEWYHGAVDFVVEQGIMKGDAIGTFRPTDAITRAEMAQILYNLNESPEFDTDIVFSDVAEGDWWYNAVMWAASEGLVKGDPEGTYRPEDLITREEMVTIIWRYFGSQEPENGALTFADAGTEYEWATAPIAWAVESGVVRGNEDNTFAPKDNTLRCEIAQVMLNIFG